MVYGEQWIPWKKKKRRCYFKLPTFLHRLKTCAPMSMRNLLWTLVLDSWQAQPCTYSCCKLFIAAHHDIENVLSYCPFTTSVAFTMKFRLGTWFLTVFEKKKIANSVIRLWQQLHSLNCFLCFPNDQQAQISAQSRHAHTPSARRLHSSPEV